MFRYAILEVILYSCLKLESILKLPLKFLEKVFEDWHIWFNLVSGISFLLLSLVKTELTCYSLLKNTLKLIWKNNFDITMTYKCSFFLVRQFCVIVKWLMKRRLLLKQNSAMNSFSFFTSLLIPFYLLWSKLLRR